MSTTNVVSVGPTSASYNGGDTLTLAGTGFGQVEASGLGGFERGKKKKRKRTGGLEEMEDEEIELAGDGGAHRKKDKEENPEMLNKKSIECINRIK